ncbi:aldo/keto reductase [Conexibacter sp. SYSU D00693]|uniref:aldo/keto reductase n=1 Tax=Conexibacter sp. SYSU D00693 TaxID=2812560 RepID=UPI00196B6EF4|nr:aldo/keto reductase [Conexibacter sp. SYSU D00693]
MHLRRLGRTGFEVSEVGFGAWGISGVEWIGAQDDESVQALERAIDRGLNVIDTALAYGPHHSERLVGQVVRRCDEDVVVATKVPPKNQLWPAAAGSRVEDVFPRDHVRACAERSLRNLGMEAVDLLQLHVWLDDWLDQGDWQEEVEALRDEGKIRAFGISINDHQPETALRAVASGLVDTVQVIYNVFDQSPEDELFPLCEEHRVGVLARVPLDEGGLTGRITPETEFADDDFRKGYFAGDRARQVQERVAAIAADLGRPVEDVPEIALRFCLSHPAVSTVIPGMRSVRNVERNCAIADGRGLPAADVQKLRAHRWTRNFYLPA